MGVANPRLMVQADVAIIGAGPIGLELAVAFKQLGIRTIHLEAGQVGQTISWFPKQVRFFSSPERIAIAGVPLQNVDQSKATREEYLVYLHGICQQFDLPINTYERVTDITPNESGGLTIHSQHRDGKQCYRVKNAVLAIGDMHQPRLLNIPGENLPHVSHYFDEPHRYFRQRLLIVGGKNSAVEAALRCYRANARVTISYRRNEFDHSIKYWLRPELEVLIKTGQLTFQPKTVPIRITPQHVTLRMLENGECRDVDANFVLLLTGYEMDSSLFQTAGVELRGPNRAPTVNEQTMQTNVSGLYVAGTAAAGTQAKFRLFLENSHNHVQKIVRAITGRDPLFDASDKTNAALTAQRKALPES